VVSNKTGTSDVWSDFWPKTQSDSGVRVTPESLLQYAPIFYAVQKHAGHIAICLLELLREVGDEIRKTRRGELAVKKLVTEKPNDLMNAYTLKETVAWQSIVYGNGRIAILRSGASAAELHLMPAQRSHTVIIRRSENDWEPEKWHYTTTENGKAVWIPDEDVFHIMNMSKDGIEGMSLADLARNSVGGGLAAEQHSNKFYANGAVPTIILEAPEGMYTDDQEAREFIDDFNRYHSGPDRSNRAGLLRNGVKANTLAVVGRDAQFIENRKFAREEAALWTAVESMLGVESNVSYNSLQQRNQAYFQNGLAKWLEKWVQEANAKLLSEAERERGYFFHWDTHAILQGSASERYLAYETARKIGLKSQEEIREEEGLPPPDPEHNFQNPNTSSSETPSPGGEELEEDDDATDPEPNGDDDEQGIAQRLRAVLDSQLLKLLKHEQHRVREMARDPSSFVPSVERFYNQFGSRLGELIESLGGDPLDGRHHADESFEKVLHVSGLATAENLASEIDSLVATWPVSRCQVITDKIMGVCNAT